MAKRRRIRPASVLDSFSPIRTVSQILSLQLIYYASAFLLILFTTLVAGTPFSLDLIFSWKNLRGDNTIGWMLGLVWMLNSLINVITLTLVVVRTKLVLDFSLTLHFIHLVVTTWYSGGLPWNWLWWMLQFSSAVLMVSLATWTCQWRELRPISWPPKPGGAATRSAPDAGPSYEMVSNAV